MQETPVQFLAQEDPVEEGMATHSNILAWKLPMGKRGWWATVLGGHKEADMTEQLSTDSTMNLITSG